MKQWYNITNLTVALGVVSEISGICHIWMLLLAT